MMNTHKSSRLVVVSSIILSMILAMTTVHRAQASSIPGTVPSTSVSAAGPLNAAETSTNADITSNSLGTFYSTSGQVSDSVDGLGTLANTGTIRVNKPAGATVRAAFLLAASTGASGYQIPDGDVLIDSAPVNWATTIPNSIYSYNSWSNVTSMVQQKIDAAPPGLIDFTITELHTDMVDGEILAVVFNDPSQPANNSVSFLFGAQNVNGDTFNVKFANPVVTTDPNFYLTMSLGISFGYQANGTQQYSIVDVNGQRLTTSAGGEDDQQGPTDGNGALLTVGGIGDSTANPADPYATPTNPRSDDELYDLKPFIKTGDTSFNVFTQNPSNDDNIFFAAFVTNPPTTVINQQCDAAAPIPVTLPEVDAPSNIIISSLKQYTVSYLPLPLQFAASPPASDTSCSFSATGTLKVQIEVHAHLGPVPFNVPLLVDSVATATLDFIKDSTTIPACDWTYLHIAPVINCSIGGAGSTLVRWHTSGFSEQLAGVQIWNSGPLTYYAYVDGSDTYAQAVQAVEPFIHKTLIAHLGEINWFYLIQEPPVDLNVQDASGNVTGVTTPGGPATQDIPYSQYVTDNNGYSAVILFAPSTTPYTVTALGAPGSPYSLSIAKVIPSVDGANQSTEQQLSGTLGPSGHVSVTCFDAQGRCNGMPPITQASLSPQSNAAGWNNGPVAVTLSATDNSGGSGVANTYFAVDNAACTPSALTNCTTYGGSAFTVSGDGTHTVTFFSVDNAGDVEAANTATVKIDTTAPSCALTGTGVNGQGQKYIQITVGDTDSGLAGQPTGVVVTENNNATMSIPSFAAGTTSGLVVTATKIDQSQGAQVALKITDVAGNVTTCDPVLTEMIRDTHRPTTTTATGIPQSEHLLHIYNGNPGLSRLTINVDGHKVHERDLVPNQQYTIDIASALQPGSNNTVTVIARGKQRGEATIVIADS